jgi:hypothetical protein
VVGSIRDPEILRRFGNPLGVRLAAAVIQPLIVVVQVAEVLGITSLALRFRRSRGEERRSSSGWPTPQCCSPSRWCW